MNEIYFTHAIGKIEGKKKGPGTIEGGSLMKYFGDIWKPGMSKLVDREKLVIPVTKMASLHLRKKIEWFSDKKEQRNDHSFRNDHMCLLALTCYTLMEVLENMKLLLAYKQEATCHARWITTASAYLRLLIFDVWRLDDYPKLKLKLIRLILYIISEYVPSFSLIHLKSLAAESLRIILFQRDLLLAYREINSEPADVVLKYFYEDAVQ